MGAGLFLGKGTFWKKEGAKLAWTAAFAAAMGYLESAVVVYLRLLYCPGGFGFPLKDFMDPRILSIEIVRELSTLIMIFCVAALAASGWKDRLAYFLFMFAVWDVFYYVWLKVELGWPPSFMTDDLLFLIPWPWVGPVLAPLAVSLTMILLSFRLLDGSGGPRPREWFLWTAGSLMILYAFLADYGRLLVQGAFFKGFSPLTADPGFQRLLSGHAPGPFDWALFLAGEAVVLAGLPGLLRGKG
jgi:hypothetical protein